MAWFQKPNSLEVVAPQPCRRCGERLATVHIRTLWRAPSDKARARPSDWWLCAECARALRPDAPPSS